MKAFRWGCYVLVFTGLSHLTGQIILTPYFHQEKENAWLPANEKEKVLLDLMNSYQRNIGGSAMNLIDLQDGLSICYSLFFLWTGLLNLYLSIILRDQKKNLCNASLVNAVMLLPGIAVSLRYFFWLPVLSFGAAFILFTIASAMLHKKSTVHPLHHKD
jgi:hypothetical protein